MMGTLKVLCTCPTGDLHPKHPPLDDVTWFVQISDTHLGAFDAMPDNLKHYGDKAGDLRYLHAIIILLLLHRSSASVAGTANADAGSSGGPSLQPQSRQHCSLPETSQMQR